MEELFGGLYHNLHAIYGPDDSGPHEGCHCLAVDLFHPGQTYRVYCKQVESGRIEVLHAERW